MNDVAEVVKHYGEKDYEEVRKKARLSGFNSILAVQSIEAAKFYYNESQRQMAELPENKKLKIATIFSYGVNDEMGEEIEDEDSDSTEGVLELVNSKTIVIRLLQLTNFPKFPLPSSCKSVLRIM